MKHSAVVLFMSLSLASLARAEASAGDTSPLRAELSSSVTFGLSQPALWLGAAEVAMARTTVFGLPRNVGTVDRVIRGVIAAVLVGVGSYRLATDAPMPGWTAALFAVSAIPAATAAIGYCPAYHLFGWSTDL